MVPRRMQRAFSVAELVVAIGVFTFGIAVIYDQFINIKRPSLYRLQQAQATQLATGQLEALRAADADALRQFNPPDEFQQIQNHPDFYSKTTVEPTDQGALLLSVQVGWEPESDSEGQEFQQGHVVEAKGYRYPS